MAQHRSFKEYIANRFYNELFSAVSDFLRDNCEKLDVSSRFVRTVDNAELSDINVKHAYVDILPHVNRLISLWSGLRDFRVVRHLQTVLMKNRLVQTSPAPATFAI
jgi:hypothetical protein